MVTSPHVFATSHRMQLPRQLSNSSTCLPKEEGKIRACMGPTILVVVSLLSFSLSRGQGTELSNTTHNTQYTQCQRE